MFQDDDTQLKSVDARSGRAQILRRATQCFKHLYHIAEAENLASILKHGLMSTERLTEKAGIPQSERTALLRSHRQANVHLPTGVLVRDQRPMPPGTLAGALDDGLEPSDWYALLNGFVFLWPDRARMERHLSACGGRPQAILTFDGPALLDGLAAKAFVSPINSGNACRKAARRGRDTLVPYATWLRGGWPTGQRTRPPAELLFNCVVPTEAPYLIDITEA
jgi:hypothetical protein